mgnify:FL=1
MNIFCGIILGQVLFYVSLRYWDSIIYMHIGTLAYTLYVIFHAIRKSYMVAIWKQIHKWLFPIFATCLIEILWFLAMTALVEIDILPPWILYLWMAWITRFYTIPLTIFICFHVFKRIKDVGLT